MEIKETGKGIKDRLHGAVDSVIAIQIISKTQSTT